MRSSEQDFITDALPAFISEAREQVETIEQLMLQLEDAPDDRELLDALFRCAHTVKGSAGIFGLDAVVGFTHHVETLLDQLREGQRVLSPELSTLLLQCNDQIRSLVAAALAPQVEVDEALAARALLVERLQAASGSANQSDNDRNPTTPTVVRTPRPPGTWQVSVQFGLDTLRNGMDPLALLGYLAGIGEISGLHCDQASLPAIDSLDAEDCHLGFDFSLVTEAAQPEIEAAFSFVRDDCVLRLTGGETELDKSVVERIADPLMHLVRNALDHGLETPAQRLASGKSAQGHLTLSACHESGSILIRIDDDGRGINRDKVLQRAWDSGLLERGSQPADDEIVKLIFEPGFSTASEVTKLSGRGVGMDVVRRNIEALRGTVTVASDPGQGTQIEIRMPLTLAIIDGFLVGVGASKFVFPLDAVVEVIERGQAAMGCAQGGDDGPERCGRGVVELRGQVLPVLDLRRLYGLDSPEPERSSVVVIRAGSSRYGVIVDQLLGQHQTVIKPLGRMLSSLRGMSGSSILGNGEVALIFDVASLSQLAAQQPATPNESSTSPKRQATIHPPSLEGQA